MISRLVYISKAKAELSPDDIHSILDAARERNTEHDVSGLLLFDGVHFMQLLEGNMEAVEFIFWLISQDERHTDIVRIASEMNVERQFKGWSMGYDFSPHPDFSDRAGAFQLTSEALSTALPENIDPAIKMMFTSFMSVAPHEKENVA